MKTKNMRKKALLSSVAMLLVAVVALSSATYAWFTANSAASVHGVKLTSTTASSLQFSTTENGTYSAILDLAAADQTLTPVSTVDATAFFKVNADSSVTVGTAGETNVASIGTAETALYYTTTFWVKAGVDTGLAVTSIDAGNLASALRVSLTIGGTTYILDPQVSGTTYGINKAETTTTGVTYAELYKGQTSTNDVVKDCTAIQTALSTGATKIGTIALNANVAQQITMKVWLEGNDVNCTDALANVSLDDLNIHFALAA
jgi:hypothetical protein